MKNALNQHCYDKTQSGYDFMISLFGFLFKFKNIFTWYMQNKKKYPLWNRLSLL